MATAIDPKTKNETRILPIVVALVMYTVLPLLGKKKLLIFIHGFEGSEKTFATFPDDLCRNSPFEYLVYPTYKCRGDRRVIIQELIKFIDKHADSSKYSNITLLGHSMGGIVAVEAYQELKKRNPPQTIVSQIIFFDSPFHGISQTVITEIMDSQIVMPAIKALFNTSILALLPVTIMLLGYQIISSFTNPNETFTLADLIEKINLVYTDTVATLDMMSDFLAVSKELWKSIKADDQIKFNGFFIQKVIFFYFIRLYYFGRVNIPFVILENLLMISMK